MPAYQPLTPAVFPVLLALADGDKHGYAIMKSVEEHTGGTLKMGAGTLYGTLQRLSDAAWVSEVTPPQVLTVTAGVTLLLWSLALRPWLWAWNLRQLPPRPATPADITEAELLMVAAGAMLPVIVVLLWSMRLLKRRA